MPDIENSFTADEQVASIQVDITGAETATLTDADYTETDNGDGTYTYTATYTAGTAGDYTFTLQTAEDSSGNNGAYGQSDTVSVSTTQTVDNFEDATAGPYASGEDITTYYSGDTPPYQRATSTVKEGSYALESSFAGNDDNNVIYSTSGGGLPAYPQQGDTFGCWMRVSSSGTSSYTAALSFGVTDRTNHYRVEVRPSGTPSFNLNKWVDGSASILDSASPSLSDGTWYKVDVSWGTDDSITATISDGSGTQLASIGATDTSYSGAVGMGFFTRDPGGDGVTAYYDNYHIEGGTADNLAVRTIGQPFTTADILTT